MKKIIFLLLCSGMLISAVGCGENTAPTPTESPPTTVSETIITRNANRNNIAYNGGKADRERKRTSPDRKRGSGNRTDCD